VAVPKIPESIKTANRALCGNLNDGNRIKMPGCSAVTPLKYNLKTAPALFLRLVFARHLHNFLGEGFQGGIL
jgi:hypothetical protein